MWNNEAKCNIEHLLKIQQFALSCRTPGPARLKGFARYLAWIWKSTVRMRLVLFLLLHIWLETHKLQFILSHIFKNIWAWQWGAKLRVTFLIKYEQRMSPHLSRADSTIGFFFWLYYSSDWIHLQNSNFSISSLSGCKRYKRWNYRMIKSKWLGLQSKLPESGGLSVLGND